MNLLTFISFVTGLIYVLRSNKKYDSAKYITQYFNNFQFVDYICIGRRHTVVILTVTLTNFKISMQFFSSYIVFEKDLYLKPVLANILFCGSSYLSCFLV